MATLDDVRRIALSLAGAFESHDGYGFSVPRKKKSSGFVWVWPERVDPKKPRVRNPRVIVIRVPNLGIKEALLASEPKKFFTDPHYDGYPAVLVRLEAVDVEELEELITEAWKERTT
jgi:hypothetical protein